MRVLRSTASQATLALLSAQEGHHLDELLCAMLLLLCHKSDKLESYFSSHRQLGNLSARAITVLASLLQMESLGSLELHDHSLKLSVSWPMLAS